jgi:hypothetical protein
VIEYLRQILDAIGATKGERDAGVDHAQKCGRVATHHHGPDFLQQRVEMRIPGRLVARR